MTELIFVLAAVFVVVAMTLVLAMIFVRIEPKIEISHKLVGRMKNSPVTVFVN